jgi:hypothetical protein
VSGVEFFLLLMALGLGATLLALGLQGRRLNDHPICRRCRFDLIGLPAGTPRCPECGADLSRPRSMSAGLCRRRRGLITAGILFIASPAGLLGMMFVRGTAIDQHLPLWALLFQSRYASAPRSAAIANEIARRVANKELSKDARQTVISAALAFQGDTRRPWASEWGDLIEDARVDGVLAAEDDARYLRQAAVFQWRCRPRVDMGDPLPIVATLKEARVGSRTDLEAVIALKSVFVDGTRTRRTTPQTKPGALSWPDVAPVGLMFVSGPSGVMAAGLRRENAGMEAEMPTNLGAGLHACDLTVHVKCLRLDRTAIIPGNILDFTGPNSSLREAHLTFDLLPEGSSSLEVVASTPEMALTIRKALDPRGPGVQAMTIAGQRLASMTVSTEGLPMGVAFDVVLRSEGQEWPLGSFTSGTSGDGMHRMSWWIASDSKRLYIGGALSDFDASSVEVILLPRPDMARRTVDLTRAYGGAIIFPQAPVGRLAGDRY